MIHLKLEKDERMGWSTFIVRLDLGGESICGITQETGEAAAKRFVALLEANETEVRAAHAAYLERRNWNYANSDKGKNWPAMRAWEKLKNRFLSEAGIKDS